MKNFDTIVASATGFCRSGVGIIRISGVNVLEVVKNVLGNVTLKERYAHYLPFYDREKKVLDKGIALLFLSPRSFTGEDMLELQGHGNPILINMIIENILLTSNVRLARPGEFSERAFLNGKIDLIQAESIMDLINSQSELAVRASQGSLQGNFSKFIYNIIEKLKNFSVFLEYNINFTNDIDNNDFDQNVVKMLTDIIILLRKIKKLANRSILIKDGMSIVITGPPNAGKSTLFNTLLNKKVAIVSKISGTTRDVLKSFLNFNGFNIELIDTAGLRDSNDTIEKIGIKLAYQEINLSNYIFLVLDSSNPKNDKIIENFLNILTKHQKLTIIFNKIDISKKSEKIESYFKKNKNITTIFLSLKNKKGFDLLIQHLKNIANNSHICECTFSARYRHIQILYKTLRILEKAKVDWLRLNSLECLLDSLNISKKEIFNIFGSFSHDDLLKRIFSQFCIGK